MRAIEFIQSVLNGKPTEPKTTSSEVDQSDFGNTPDEQYYSVDAVTKDAGGGLNGPKNPADIRSNSVSMYPNYQAKG